MHTPVLRLRKYDTSSGGTPSALRRAGRLAVAALLAATPLALGAQPARAADTWEVQVAKSDGDFEAQAFGPDPLTIRAGDTVVWTFAGFLHTVTFNSGKPQPADIVPGPGQGELVLGPGFFPLGPQGSDARYDGTQQASSGAQPFGPPTGNQAPTYRLTFTQPGRYAYVCLLHPGMRGEIVVREANAPLPETPAQAKSRGQTTLDALLGKIKQDAQMVRPASGPGVTAVAAGLGDAFGASALRFLGGDVTVPRGGNVVWTNADPFEIHTVTFPSGGTPPEFVQPRPQPSGPPQFVIPANVAGPVGGNTYTGEGLVNSGILTPGNAFVLRFDAPAGSYDYLCVIHPNMKGKVTVTG